MTRKAPVPGAARVHRLAPFSEDDAVAWLTGKLKQRGWTVLPEDAEYRTVSEAWILVSLWAIPPTVGGENDGG